MALDLAYIKTGQRGELPLDVAVARMFDHFAGELERGTSDGRQPLPALDPGGYVVLLRHEDAREPSAVGTSLGRLPGFGEGADARDHFLGN